jgi:hypothetical protein
MARNKDKLSRENKQWQRRRETQRQNDVVQHSAAVLTCATETAGEFAYLCTSAQEELDLDLPYLRVALEIWREQPNPCTQPLVAALDDLLTERRRHRDALNRIAQQLEHLKADPSLHIHLDPIDRYREWVRLRLYPPPPAK